MSASSRLGKQFAQIVSVLNHDGIHFALIGGLALASHKVIRATQDIDLLIDADDADRVERMVVAMGYRRLYRSADAANYERDDERIDFLYARRSIARQLLAAARELDTAFGRLRVVSLEGIVGFKLQAPHSSRNERDPYQVLDELMTVVEALSPRWPKRAGRTTGNHFRL